MRADNEVERILTQANVERMRGNFLSAQRLLKQALQKAPNRADIHELLGDVYKAVGDLQSALECYKKARELDPNRRSAEEKFAATLLELNQPSVADEIPFLPKNPNYAVLFSVLLPGAGQIYNEQWLKGVAMMVVTLISLGYFLQFYHQLRARTAAMPTLWQVQQQLEQASVGEILLILLSGLLAFCMWTWSILDAYKTAKRFQELQQQQRKTSQPTSDTSHEGGKSE